MMVQRDPPAAWTVLGAPVAPPLIALTVGVVLGLQD